MGTQATVGNPRKKMYKRRASSRASSSRSGAKRTLSNKRRRASAAARSAINYGKTAKKAAPALFSSVAVIGMTAGTVTLMQGLVAAKQAQSTPMQRLMTQLGIAGAAGVGALLAAPKAPQLATGLGLATAMTIGSVLFGRVNIDGQSPVKNAATNRIAALTAPTTGNVGSVMIRRRDGSLVRVNKGSNLNGADRTYMQAIARPKRQGIGYAKSTFMQDVSNRNRGLGATQITYGQQLAQRRFAG